MKKNMITVFAAALALSLGACGSKTANETAAEPAAETAAAETAAAEQNDGSVAAIVGSWKLDKVLVSEAEGTPAEEVSEEDHASLYAEKNSLYTFNEDGTGTLTVTDGADTAESEITWKDADDSFAVTADGITADYIYDPVEDTLLRQTIEKDPYMDVQFIFVRQ